LLVLVEVLVDADLDGLVLAVLVLVVFSVVVVVLFSKMVKVHILQEFQDRTMAVVVQAEMDMAVVVQAVVVYV
jgi:hypothetical protein